MTLKTMLRFQCILLAVLFVGCSDDDGENEKSYSFKDQTLSGEIGDVAFTYQTGSVVAMTEEGESVLYIRLYLNQEDPVCNPLFVDGNEVSLFVRNQVGVSKMNVRSWLDMIDRSGEEEEFNEATAGAIEILTISETTVTGRIDARRDTDNHVNGNFTVSFCLE